MQMLEQAQNLLIGDQVLYANGNVAYTILSNPNPTQTGPMFSVSWALDGHEDDRRFSAPDRMVSINRPESEPEAQE